MQEGTQEATQDTERQDGSGHSTNGAAAAKELACKQGIQAFARGDFKTAVEQLESGLQDDRVNWKARACLGLSLYNAGQLDKAKATFEYIVAHSDDEQIKDRSQQALVRVNQSLNLQAASEADNSLATAPSAEAELSGNSEATSDNGATEISDIPAEEVPSDLEPVELSAADKEKYCKWGTNCYLNEKYAKAIEYLEAALVGDEENWNGQLCLGMSYFKIEEYDRAAIILQHLIEECPDSKLTMRANQALDTVKMTQISPDIESSAAKKIPASIAAILEKQKAKKARHAAQQKGESHVLMPTAEQADRGSVATTRKTHPLAILILVLSCIGIPYYIALNCLPSFYNKMFDPPSAARSVSDMGALSGTSAKTLTIPGPHLKKINGVLYDKYGASKLVIIHPDAFDDWERRKSLATALLQAGFSVVLYDSEGNGGSTGDRSWRTIADDGLFVFDYLNGQLRYKGEDLYNYGYAFGAAAATNSSTKRDSGALVLENPFTSLPALSRYKVPLLEIFPDIWCPEPHDDLPQMLAHHPSLLVVVSKDKTIPAAESQAVFARASETKQIDNLDIDAQAPHWDSIVKFLQQ